MSKIIYFKSKTKSPLFDRVEDMQDYFMNKKKTRTENKKEKRFSKQYQTFYECHFPGCAVQVKYEMPFCRKHKDAKTISVSK